MSPKAPNYFALHFFIFLSGFAGLGYEMVWTRMLAVGLGNEMVSMLAVVAAFFAGTALGSWALDRRISRSATPGRWYAAMETILGLWSLLLIVLIPWTNRTTPQLIGIEPSALYQWTIAFTVPFCVLFPATFAMGGTLPAMERLYSRLRRDGWAVGGLYAANTFGAVAGSIATTFLIAPHLGFSKALMILCLLNFMCAAGVMLGAARNESGHQPAITVYDSAGLPPRILLTLFLTGLLGIGYEVLIVRIISQVLENTIYTFANVLSVYLLGTATGAALYQFYAPRKRFEPILTYLLQLLSALCLLGIGLLWFSEDIFTAVRHLTGGGFLGAALGEASLAFAAFFLPTVAMGATFAHLAQAASGPNGGLGIALSLNTLGATISPVLFGVILLPWVGSKAALILTAVSYLFLIPFKSWRLVAPALVPLSVAIIMLNTSSDFQFVTIPPGGEVVAYDEGVMAAVSVVKDSRDEYHLKVNNKFQMGGTSSFFSDRRQGHIPLLLHPHPKKALFLGLGTGATFAACEDYPDLQADGVELLPEIIPLLPYFEKSTGNFERYQNLHIKVADARRFVQSSQDNYDVIVADLFHPARDGAGSLYTVEHFQSIRARLNPNGIFCQWLPLYQLDFDMLRAIIRTFLHVFPTGSAFLAHYSLETPILGLVAGVDPIHYPADWMQRRVADSEVSKSLRTIRLENQFDLFGCFAAGNKDLAAFAGDGPLNTDDYPVVIFGAPRFVYQEEQPPYARLIALLKHFNPQPEEILKIAGSDADRQIERRLAAYWEARNAFLLAGIGVQRTDNVKELLQRVREPLMEVVRLSPDFTAAYKPLLAMAYRLSKTDPEAGEQLLLDLEKANPENDEARQLRLLLFRNGPMV